MKTDMKFLLVEEMLSAYQSMAVSVEALRATMREYPEMKLFLPTYRDKPGGELENAIASLTEIWHMDQGVKLAEVGLISAPPVVVQAIQTLNDAKQVFKTSVVAIRKAGESGNHTIMTAVEKHMLLDGEKPSCRRSEDIREAMRITRLGRLDLLRCYRHARILEENLESISWTWARTHTSVEKITMEEAIKKAEQLPNEDSREITLNLLAAIPPGDTLIVRKQLNNQLRANLVWQENKERKRKAVTISGIVINPSINLPKMLWRDDPGPRKESESIDRLVRADSRINPEPYIQALNIHLYREK